MKNIALLLTLTFCITYFANATDKKTNNSSSKENNSAQIRENNDILLNPQMFYDLQLDDTVWACPGELVTLDASDGGTDYLWNDGNNQQIIYVTAPGVYTVTVTYSTDSVVVDSVLIINFSAMNLSFSTVMATCGNSDGSATVTVTGGNAPYSYQWNSGDTTATINNLYSAMYIVTITDANLCTTFASVNVNNSNGPVVTSIVTTNISCYGSANGSIITTVTGGQLPYTFSWSNGDSTQNIHNLQPGPYDIMVTDFLGCTTIASSYITEPDQLYAYYYAYDATCGNNDGSIYLDIHGGVAPYTYLWSNAQTTDTLLNLYAGVYECTVTDSTGCILQNLGNIVVSNSDGPYISVYNVIDASCGSATGEIDIAVYNDVYPPYTYLWSNGDTTQNLINVVPGYYDVTVTNSIGCIGAASGSISETVPSGVEICVVTVDSATKKNVIVWDKSTTTSCDHFNIYKESTQAGIYQKIGTTPYSSPSYFIDNVSNPFTRSWRYKISAEDGCGNESPLSMEHKTIHLNINVGINNTFNLIWDNYEGFTYNSVVIYRYSDSTFTILDTLPSNATSYSDLNPVQKTFWYQVGAIMNGNSCQASKAVGGPYSQSISNPEDNGIFNQGVETSVKGYKDLLIYPNPFNDKTTIKFDNPNHSFYDITLTDITGKVVKEIRDINTSSIQISKDDLSSGFYFIKITGEYLFKGKMIIE